MIERLLAMQSQPEEMEKASAVRARHCQGGKRLPTGPFNSCWAAEWSTCANRWWHSIDEQSINVVRGWAPCKKKTEDLARDPPHISLP